MEKRYVEWAGTGWPKGWNPAFPEGTVVWPIVDTETCGVIDGSPTPEQWFCVAMTPESQSMIAAALNTARRM